METSLARRRMTVLALGAGLLAAGTLGGSQLRGGIAAALGFDLLTGERVRVELDASVGRTEMEQLGRDLDRAAGGLQSLQVEQARSALIAMGVEGAGSMSDEEVQRLIRDAQLRAIRNFHESGAASGQAAKDPAEIR